MIEIRSPAEVDWRAIARPSVFLAGSIENGKAEDWQAEFVEQFKDQEGTIINPRRADWDPAMSAYRHPELIRQIQWEMRSLAHVDVIFMYFAPGTVSPISLLEQGWFGYTRGPARMVTVCPPEFFRATNVEVFCKEVGIPVYPTFEAGVEELKERLLYFR